MATTKDKNYNATNVPNTASEIEEEEDTKVIVEHKYIMEVKDDTINDNVVNDDGGFKDSNTVQARDVDQTLNGEGMVVLFAGTLFIAYSDDISSKKTILFVNFIISFLSS